jgi:hypothetical protein
MQIIYDLSNSDKTMIENTINTPGSPNPISAEQWILTGIMQDIAQVASTYQANQLNPIGVDIDKRLTSDQINQIKAIVNSPTL